MFLSDVCIDHGQIGYPPQACCAGLTPYTWTDQGQLLPNNGIQCWTATCVPAGKASGPNGVDMGKCCAGLVSVNGFCAVPTSGSGGGGGTPLPLPSSSGQIIPGVDNMILYAVAGGLVLLMVMGKKKSGA